MKLSFPVKKMEVEEQEETTEGSTSSPYRCPICYRTLTTQQQLESHVAMHTDNSFPCHICGKVIYMGFNIYIYIYMFSFSVLFRLAKHVTKCSYMFYGEVKPWH